MLKIEPTLNHIPAKREHVIALYESINQPLVNVPNYGTAPTGAFILGTRNDQGFFTVFVYLFQPETRAVVIYVSEPRSLTAEQYRLEEAEGVRFVESMGFMVDNVHFPTLAPPEQETVMGRVPLFRPPERTVDLYEVADDARRAPAFAAPGVESLDALFGGLNPADGEIFRRAGLAPGSNPPGFGSPRPSTPGLGQSTLGPPGFGPPAGNPFGAAPSPFPSSSRTSPGLGYGPPPASPPPPPAGFATGLSAPPPGFVSGPPSPPRSNPSFAPAPAEDPQALARLGRLLGAFGALLALAAGGGSACKSYSEDAPPDPGVESNVDLGNQQLAQGRFPDAIQSFQAALEADDKHKDALRGTALAYLNLGRNAEAEAFYRRALASDPKFSLVKNELAVVLMNLNRCAEAEPLLLEVLGDIFYTTPEYAEHNLARAEACQGRFPEALARLEKLLVRRPLFCLGYLTMAELSAQAKRPELTIGACDDFARQCEAHAEIKAQISPEQSTMCYLRKGLAHAQLGDVESARASFERCQPVGAVGKECQRSLEMLSSQ